MPNEAYILLIGQTLGIDQCNFRQERTNILASWVRFMRSWQCSSPHPAKKTGVHVPSSQGTVVILIGMKPP